MNKIVISTLCSLLLLSSSSFAADPPTYTGTHQLGFVNVNSTITYMEGRLNVRAHPSPGHENSYVYTHHYANNVVWFQGRDSVTNRYFACVVYTTDALYDQAVDIQNNSQDGARLLVWKDANSSKCTQIGLSNGSQYIQ